MKDGAFKGNRGTVQLQQLRYLLAAAESGSFREAAHRLYVSQSSVSVAVKDLEDETGVSIFERTSRGITLTNEGAELLDYARAVIEQASLLENRYARANRRDVPRLAVSSQHYSLVVDAFGDFARLHERGASSFSLRETHVSDIMRDVQELRSDLGIIYLSNHNDRVMGRALAEADLAFTSLYVARPHIIVHCDHPLAGKDSLTPADLKPYYRFEQAQGADGSSYFAEEPVLYEQHERRIEVTDNGTLSSLLANTNGFAIGTGAFIDEGRFSSIPLETDEIMNVGFITRKDARTSPLADEFLKLLASRILAFEGPIEISPVAYELAGQD